MKKILAVLTVIGVASSAMADWAQQLQWGSQENFLSADSLPDVVDSTGAVIPTTSTWAAQILDALDNNIVYVTATHPGGDAGFWDFYGDPGVAFQAVTLPIAADNRQIFTRLYNNSDPLLATLRADVGATTFDWNSTAATPPTPVSYDFGTVGTGDWVAIPEPGAASLLILGVGTLLARRVRSRMATK